MVDSTTDYCNWEQTDKHDSPRYKNLEEKSYNCKQIKWAGLKMVLVVC